MKRVFLLCGTFLLSLIIYKGIDQYLFCPDYGFHDPFPFSGEHLYNPYQNKLTAVPSLANFHAHGHAWLGLTNGKGTAADIHSKYDSLGYRFHAVSQYHHIDTTLNESSNYVSAYEHGYNIKKTHQLVIGARQVFWKDYLFPQTLDNEQEILFQLAKDTSNLVVINHPANRNGYPLEYLKKLQYYDYIELLNPVAQSIDHWDVILSSGKRVYAMGNDDLHNIYNTNQIGRFVTFIYGNTSDSKRMIQSLRSGSAVAVWLPQCENESLQEKKSRIDRLKTILRKVEVDNNQFVVSLNAPAKELRVITDGGNVKRSEENTVQIKTSVNQSETYWRTEILLYDGTRMFLNPITRSGNDDLSDRNQIAFSMLKRKENGPLKIASLLAIIIIIGSTGFNRRISKLKYLFRPSFNRSKLSN